MKNEGENKQASLFPEDLSPLEKKIYELFIDNNELSSDQISKSLDKPLHQLSSALLKLEFSGLIAGIPGNIYRKKNAIS